MLFGACQREHVSSMTAGAIGFYTPGGHGAPVLPCLVVCIVLAAPAWAAVPATTPTTFADEAARSHDVYLEVELNGQHRPALVRFGERNGRLFATGRDLDAIGLATGKLGVADAAEVPLDALQGVRYRYNAGQQTVAITVDDSLRKPYTIDSRQLQQAPAASSGRGLVVNYDVFAQSDARARMAVWTEERYFDPHGVFSNTGVAYLYADTHRYLRYDTYWSRSNPGSLSTIQIGDMISSSLAWSRSVRMAGFQWRSDFALRPDLVTFPVPSLSGTAVVPSAVDLYINNVRQLRTDVPSGPFVFNDVPGINGAGQATLITHDALGRSVATSLPLYVDTRLLAKDLSSYSFEAGYLRRDYGQASFNYGADLAGSGSARRGITDAFTLEGHAEATRGLFNVGAGALVRLGMTGVVNGSLSASGGRLAGTQASLGYQLIEPHFAIDAQITRAFRNYGDLAARDDAPVPTAIDQLTVSLPFFSDQNLAFSYIGLRMRGIEPSHIGSISYTMNFGNLLSLNLSGYQDFRRHESRGIFLGMNIGLGDRTSINSTVGRQNGQSYYNASAIRPPDYDGGWGWGLQGGGSGGVAYRQAQLQYLGNQGQLTGMVQNIAGRTTASLDALGSVVLMDGSVHAARRIYDGFALVSTDGVAGIPVLHDNRVIGSTDRGGHLLIPDLNAYQNNQVAIDSMKLPVDMRIDTTSFNLVPQAQSGVLARFPIARYAAASVILHDARGKSLLPGSRVHHVESDADTVVGYDGLTFISDLQKTNHLVIEGKAGRCKVNFSYHPSPDHRIPTIGPLTCRASKEASP